MLLISLISANLASVHFLKSCKKALSALTAFTLGHHELVQLECQGGSWDRQVASFALVEYDAKILNEVLHVEAGLKVSLEHSWTKLLHAEATSSSLRQQIDHLLVVEAGLLSVKEGLTKTNHGCPDHDLVGSFRMLAGARSSHMLNLLRVDIKEGLAGGDSSLGATHHSHKLSILCSNVTPRNWCIN